MVMLVEWESRGVMTVDEETAMVTPDAEDEDSKENGFEADV